ncbi:MAG: putative nucleotide-diphospho-sugar transferase [Pseudomonadota bacterium]
MTKKLCITTAYDMKFGMLGNYCASSIQHYADTFGYEARIVSDAKIKERHPAWYRIQLIQQLFAEGYEWVMWLDADAIFVRFDVDVLDQAEDGSDLYFVHETGFSGAAYQPAPNSGVMLFRNSDWSKKLLSEIWAETQYSERFPWEQGALWKILGHHDGLSRLDKTHLAKENVNQEYYEKIKLLPKQWNAMTTQNGLGCDDPVIVHMAGQPQDLRHRAIRAYWSSITGQGTEVAHSITSVRLEAENLRLKKSLERLTRSKGLRALARMRRWFEPRNW